MNLNFHMSSYSGGEGNCIAVADDAGRVAVMDTKDKQGPVLRFSAAAWRQFAKQLKSLASSGIGQPLAITNCSRYSMTLKGILKGVRSAAERRGG